MPLTPATGRRSGSPWSGRPGSDLSLVRLAARLAEARR